MPGVSFYFLLLDGDMVQGDRGEKRGKGKGHAFSLNIDINAFVICDGVLAVDAFIADVVGVG